MPMEAIKGQSHKICTSCERIMSLFKNSVANLCQYSNGAFICKNSEYICGHDYVVIENIKCEFLSF